MIHNYSNSITLLIIGASCGASKAEEPLPIFKTLFSLSLLSWAMQDLKDYSQYKTILEY